MFTKNCNKGYPCGASCINKADDCRHGLSNEGSRALDNLLVSRKLYNKLASWYSTQDGLDTNSTPQALAHDAIHSIFNLGVTLDEERLVLNIENSLSGGEVDNKMLNQVDDALASLTDFDLLSEVIELLEKVK